MLTVAQVSQQLQLVLGEVAREAGRQSGFIQRQRKLDGASYVQTLVFGWMANPQASLEELSQAAATCGVDLSPQAIHERFTPAGAACLKHVLEASLTVALEADGQRSDFLQRFEGVYLQDSTVIPLPAALASVWLGNGNQTGSSAGLKVQTVFDYRHGRLSLSLHPAQRHDCPLQTVDLPAGALRLADTGYFALDHFDQLSQRGVWWVTRVPAKTRLWDAHDQKWTLSQWLKQHAQAGWYDGWVLLTAKRWPCRLLAQAVADDVAAQRLARLQADARKRGTRVSAERAALCHWTVCVTNLPADQLSLEEALLVLRLRWQIELLFKLWKSQAQLSAWRSHQPWRILSEVYAKLLALVVQHWLLMLGCWDVPDRSLVKAVQVLRKHAFHLAAVFAHPARLTSVLRLLQRTLRRCRIQKRRVHPATFQRLANPSAFP